MRQHCGRVVVAVVLGLSVQVAAFATPDFSGTWERYPSPYSDERFPEEPPPPGGGPQFKEPYASAYKKLNQRKAEADKAGKPLADRSTQCLPQGVPTIMAAVEPIEILQTPQQIVILAEFLTQTRRIYLNEKMPASEDVSPGYNGYSVGRWQGDTLIVQTIGVREDVRFVDIPHSSSVWNGEPFVSNRADPRSPRVQTVAVLPVVAAGSAIRRSHPRRNGLRPRG